MSIDPDFDAEQNRTHTLEVLDQLHILGAVDNQDAVDAALTAPDNIEAELEAAIGNARNAVREAVSKAKKVDAATLTTAAQKVPNEDALYHVATLHVSRAWKDARALIDTIAQTVPDRVNSHYADLMAQVPDVEDAAHHETAEQAYDADQLDQFLTLRTMTDWYKTITDAVFALRHLNVLPDTDNPNEAWAFDYKTPTAEWLNGRDDVYDGSGTEHEQLIRELKRHPYVPATDDEAHAVLAEYQPLRQQVIDKRVADKVPDNERPVNVPRDASDLIDKMERQIAREARAEQIEAIESPLVRGLATVLTNSDVNW